MFRVRLKKARPVLQRPERIVLASASPRRLELLASAGYTPEVRACSIAEPEVRPEYVPIDLWPMMLAFLKARNVQASLRDPRATVIGADTIVVLHDEILGKPKDVRHARAMLEGLSGKRHDVITGLAVLRGTQQRLTRAISVCKIKRLRAEWLDDYLHSGHWRGKAGAYGIQDDRREEFVTLVSGEWSNVVGLPMKLLAAELQSLRNED